MVLQALHDNRLFVKKSKCAFRTRSVAYLEHVITAEGVAMDEQKIRAVLEWPLPRSVQAFLGLVGYYHRFIRDYGTLAPPPTRLLQKEGFKWCDKAAEAFNALKCALTTVSVLQLPDFTVAFVIECDAFGTGFGVVLHQGAGPVAFYSKPIAPRHAKFTAYECELIGLGWCVRCDIGSLTYGVGRFSSRRSTIA
jgi:hypothetical protein